MTFPNILANILRTYTTITIVGVFASLNVSAQDSTLNTIFPMKEGRVFYEKVISVDSSSRDELYRRTVNWALQQFVSQKDANQVSDKESGIVSYSSFMKVDFPNPSFKNLVNKVDCWHTTKVFLKDNKARIVVTDLQYRYPAVYMSEISSPAREINVEEMKDYIDSNLQSKLMKRNFKEKYWQDALISFKDADAKIKVLIASWEKALSQTKTDFDF